MHWFGELLGWYIFLLVIATAILGRWWVPRWKAKRDYYKSQANLNNKTYNAFHLLRNANESAIAELESPLYAGFPQSIRQQMMDAHAAAYDTGEDK